MYCIGWKPKANCTKEIDFGPDGNPACPSSRWFWLSAAAVLIFGLAGKKGR